LQQPRQVSSRSGPFTFINRHAAAPSVKGCGRADCCQLSGESEAAPAKFPQFNLKPYKVGTELIFSPIFTKQALSPLKFGSASPQWLRPTTLSELLAIKAQYPDTKLVGGSTEIQIEVKIKAAAYPVSVFVSDIAELHGLWPPTPTRRTFEFGTNLSLADLKVACK
jgi:xanthine dehydrogenase/oxidase